MKISSSQTFILVAIAAVLVVLATARTNAAESAERMELVARGEYLVKGIGLCADCHTPMNSKGQPDLDHWLMGAALPFQPTIEMPWAAAAPPIAGLPSMTEEQAIAFFMKGQRPDGTTPRPPMPSYRLSEADARAVTAYLKSLVQ